LAIVTVQCFTALALPLLTHIQNGTFVPVTAYLTLIGGHLFALTGFGIALVDGTGATVAAVARNYGRLANSAFAIRITTQSAIAGVTILLCGAVGCGGTIATIGTTDTDCILALIICCAVGPVFAISTIHCVRIMNTFGSRLVTGILCAVIPVIAGLGLGGRALTISAGISNRTCIPVVAGNTVPV